MMGKIWKLVILGVFLLVVLTMGCVSSKKALREELTQQKEKLQEEIENKKWLENKIQGLEKEKEALEKMKAEKKRELEKRAQELEKRKEALEKMRIENERIKEEFQDHVVKSQIEIWEAKKGLVISFIDKVLFDSGKAEIKPQAYPVLEKVAQIIKDYPKRPVLIGGHTDNVPIGPRLKSRYQTNWELSTARAVAILRYLIRKRSLPPEQLAAAGYGKYHPIDSNETAEGRQKNRRVEVVIMPEQITRE